MAIAVLRASSLVASPDRREETGLPHPSHQADAITAQLAFTRAEDVGRDDAPRGGLRARTLDDGAMQDPWSYDQRTCHVTDCSTVPDFDPDLRVHGFRVHGFARADLSRLHGLQAALQRIRAAGRVGDADAAAVRRSLVGRCLPLSGGAACGRCTSPARV